MAFKFSVLSRLGVVSADSGEKLVAEDIVSACFHFGLFKSVNKVNYLFCIRHFGIKFKVSVICDYHNSYLRSDFFCVYIAELGIYTAKLQQLLMVALFGNFTVLKDYDIIRLHNR